MKQSNYNIYIPHSGFTILYNSYTDRFLGVSNGVADLLKKNNLDGLNIQSAVWLKMKALGMLIDDNVNEIAELEHNYHETKYNNRKLYFMVYPTQDCNLKCWYCYESHKKGTKMSQDVLAAVQKYVEKAIEANEFDSLHLAFFGGEPLLNFSKVASPLAHAIKQMCESAGKIFSSFFVTNASLMTEEIVEDLADLNPYFQITLDGDAEKHDQVRIWKRDERGTYRQIMNAVHLITKNMTSPKNSDDPLITLRINYDNDTLRHIDTILNDLKDIDKNKVRIHFERVWQTRSLIDREQQQLLLTVLGKFVKEGFIISHGVFRRKDIACPSDSMSFFIVNYDGTIHKCNGRTLDEKTQEGILDAKGTILWDETRRKQRMDLETFNNPTCLSCKILPLCMGPCSQKYLEEGKFTRNICSKNSLDFSIEEYLAFEFEMRYYLEKMNQK